MPVAYVERRVLVPVVSLHNSRPRGRSLAGWFWLLLPLKSNVSPDRERQSLKQVVVRAIPKNREDLSALVEMTGGWVD